MKHAYGYPMKIAADKQQLSNLRADPSRVVILGAGRSGLAMIETLAEEELVEIVAVVDINGDAPGLHQVKGMGIPTFTDVETALISSAPCVAFNLTGNEMVEEVAAAILGVGAVVGGLEARLIHRMVTDLKEAKNELQYQATHDVLTGLMNRRFMVEKLLQEIDRCKRYNVSCAVVMMDLDHFKSVNDERGHAVGDRALKVVSSSIANQIRGADSLARWGGEEFLLLLPHADKPIATQVAEKCLVSLRDAPIEDAVNGNFFTSFSAGVACINELDLSLPAADVLDDLLAIADKRLYAAKARGRACVVADIMPASN